MRFLEFIKTKRKPLIVLGVIIISAPLFFYWPDIQFQLKIVKTNKSCFQVKEQEIKELSMGQDFGKGKTVKVLDDYYNCNSVKKGETVLLGFKTQQKDFVRNLIGLAGDQLEFVGENLKLNGQILKNSQGKPYLFNERAKKLLTIPLKDGKIPEGYYFVLSEMEGPESYDSRWYGFVEDEHLKGRVID